MKARQLQHDEPLRRVSYRLRSFDEDFGLAQLELVLVHVDGVEEVQDSLALLLGPAWPGLLRQDGIPAAHKPPLACWKRSRSFQDGALFDL